MVLCVEEVSSIKTQGEVEEGEEGEGGRGALNVSPVTGALSVRSGEEADGRTLKL